MKKISIFCLLKIRGFVKMEMERRGVSEVISTVLLIMLAIAAASILYIFIVPMIKNMLEGSKTCYDLREQVKIESGAYTCADATAGSTKLQIRIAEEGGQVSGLIVNLDAGGVSHRYEIKNNTGFAGVTMLGESSILMLPHAGGAETYIFDRTAESARVAPIAENGKVCDAVEETIEKC